MFELTRWIRLITLLNYLFFITSGIIGLSIFETNCYSNLPLSIHIILVGLIMIYYELYKENQDEKELYVNRIICLIWNGFLIMAMNKIILGFAIYSIITGIINSLYYVLVIYQTNDSLLVESTINTV